MKALVMTRCLIAAIIFLSAACSGANESKDIAPSQPATVKENTGEQDVPLSERRSGPIEMNGRIWEEKPVKNGTIWHYCEDRSEAYAQCWATRGDEAPKDLPEKSLFAVNIGPYTSFKETLAPLGQELVDVFGRGHIYKYKDDAYLKIYYYSASRGERKGWHLDVFAPDCAEKLGLPVLIEQTDDMPTFTKTFETVGATPDKQCLSFENNRGCIDREIGTKPNFYNACYLSAFLNEGSN